MLKVETPMHPPLSCRNYVLFSVLFTENQEDGFYTAKPLNLSIEYKSTSIVFIKIICVPAFGI